MLSYWLSKNKLFKLFICLLTVFAFNCTFVLSDAWALLPVSGSVPQTLPGISQVENFSLPKSLGEVKFTNAGNSEKIVFHIQDAHCNYDAQKKVSEVISYLNKKYGVNCVNLEGGSGDYDLSLFTNMHNKDARGETADYFMKWGRLNGAEVFAVNNPDKVQLWGIEDSDLYLNNLSAYRDSVGYREESENYLEELDYFISNLKRHIFSEELKLVDSKYAEYKTEGIGFKDYLIFLTNKAKEKGIDIKLYSNVYLLTRAVSEEDKINFKKVNKERSRLLDILEKKMSEREITELLANTLEFRNKNISETVFYEYLIKKARQTGQKLNKYPELRKYIIYTLLYNKVDKIVIMDEIGEIESAIKEGIYRNAEEKELNQLSKNLVLMRNLFKFSITSKDYEYYKNNPVHFEISEYIRFINKYAPLYKITPTLSENLYKLDIYQSKINEFYKYAFKRDKAFLRNIKFGKLKAKDFKAAVLVTGGFHSENLLSLFEKNNISYVSIIPSFENEKDYKSPYFKILSGGKSPLEDSIDTALSTIQAASLLNSLGVDANGAYSSEIFSIAGDLFYSMIKDPEYEKKTKVISLDETRYIVFKVEDGVPSITIEEKKIVDEEYRELTVILGVNKQDNMEIQMSDLVKAQIKTQEEVNEETSDKKPDHPFAMVSKYSILGLGGGVDWLILSGGILGSVIAYISLHSQVLSVLSIGLITVMALFAGTSLVRVADSWNAVEKIYPKLTIWQKLKFNIGGDVKVLEALQQAGPFTYDQVTYHEGFKKHVTGLVAFVPFVAGIEDIYYDYKQANAPPVAAIKTIYPAVKHIVETILYISVYSIGAVIYIGAIIPYSVVATIQKPISRNTLIKKVSVPVKKASVPVVKFIAKKTLKIISFVLSPAGYLAGGLLYILGASSDNVMKRSRMARASIVSIFMIALFLPLFASCSNADRKQKTEIVEKIENSIRIPVDDIVIQDSGDGKTEFYVDLRYLDIKGLDVNDDGADLSSFKKIYFIFEDNYTVDGVQFFLKNSNWANFYSNVSDSNKAFDLTARGRINDFSPENSRATLLGIKVSNSDAKIVELKLKGIRVEGAVVESPIVEVPKTQKNDSKSSQVVPGIDWDISPSSLNWKVETYSDSQGIVDFEKDGDSIIVEVDIKGGDANTSKGEIFVDLRDISIAGLDGKGSKDLSKYRITMRIEVPEEFIHSSQPNGIQILF